MGRESRSRAPPTVTRRETTRLDETRSSEERTRKGVASPREQFMTNIVRDVFEKEIKDDARTARRMYSWLSVDGAGGRVLDVE